MRKLLFLIVVGTLLFSCKQETTISKAELKEIFSDLSGEDFVTTRHLIVDSISDFNTTILEQEGTRYFIATSDDVKQGCWTIEVFDSARIVSRTYIEEASKPDPFTKTPEHYSLSLPYFNKDKSIFVIYYNHYCGNLCAEYSLRLYKKVNGKWIFVKNFEMMVS